MRALRARTIGTITVVGWVMTAAGPASAGSHLWRFNEIFSNSDGTIQFIELKESMGAPSETALAGKWVHSVTTGKQYNFPGNLSGNTANRHLLLATSGFAALPGAPTPDYIIPTNFFSLNADTLHYWTYSAAFMTYAPGAVPTDGVMSLSITGTTVVNSPTNFAGQTGSVNAGTCTDNDSDGYGSPGSPTCSAGAAEDCNDGNSAIHPGATEVCTDGVDNDCDGATDCADSDCASVLACIPTLSEWGVVAMALLLLTAGTLVVRSRAAAL